MDKGRTYLEIIKTIKSYSKYLLIPTGVIMFTPIQLLTQWGLNPIKEQYGLWVSIIFLFSLSVFTVDFLVKQFDVQKQRKADKAILKLLNDSDKELLYRFINKGSVILPYNDAQVVKLKNMTIIGCGNMSVGGPNFSFFLQPWAELWLKKNPKFFKNIINETDKEDTPHD